MNENQITIFTDGSSRGNPGPGGYGFIALYPDSKGIMHVDEGGGREDVTTNNRMEMKAVAEAFRFFDGYYDNEALNKSLFTVYLDSSYVLNGITKWINAWVMNGWITSTKDPVSNVDIWKEMMEATAGKKIEWKLLKGHAGIAGNERCDVIATTFADNEDPKLFKGKLADYSFDPLDITASGSVSSPKKNKGKAYSYVSSVDGLVMTHKTWEECEKRVKGAKGAKFKKALDDREESYLIKNWSKL